MEDIEESNVSNDTSSAAPVLSSISSLVPLLSVGTNHISNFRKRQQDDDDFLDTEGNNEVLTSIPPIISVTAAKDEWNINETIVNVLKCDNIEYFTPVQRILIPKLLKINTKNGVMPRDFCVSAPTGSGKTLAYAIPIVQTLMNRSPTNIKLRALILLPSRELAAQVYRVICRLAKDTDLKIILASGQKSFEEEQKVLSGSFNYDKRLMNNYVDNFYTNKQYYTTDDTYESDTCDILVCTPGRFLDHIFHTNGFTLKYLRFIVLDEADRLLGNAYHDWVRLLVKSCGSSDLVNNNRYSLTHSLTHSLSYLLTYLLTY
jgi:superfamily II DNA/RNA helicase